MQANKAEGHLEQSAQEHVQTDFDYLQGCRLHGFSGQPVPVISHFHSKKAFPDIWAEPLVFQFVPIDSGPVTGHHWKESGSTLLAPSLQVFIYTDEIPPKPFLFQAELSQFFQPFLIGEMLHFYNHLHWTLSNMSMSYLPQPASNTLSTAQDTTGLFLPWGHVAGACSTWCPHVWCCSSPGTGFCASLHLTVWDL